MPQPSCAELTLDINKYCIYIQGIAKKKSPLQKWLTWFIMTMNKENINKSCVFVLTYRYLCVSIQTIIAILTQM